MCVCVGGGGGGGGGGALGGGGGGVPPRGGGGGGGGGVWGGVPGEGLLGCTCRCDEVSRPGLSFGCCLTAAYEQQQQAKQENNVL